jgi:hypothetical protein
MFMSSSAARATSFVLLALLVSGCSLLRRGDDEDAAMYEPAPITVNVANRNWSQVAVYVEIRGQRRRIGEVQASSTAALEIPDLFTMRTDLRLAATPLASSQTYRTGTILAAPGAIIQLNIENDVRLSSWSIR